MDLVSLCEPLQTHFWDLLVEVLTECGELVLCTALVSYLSL